MPTTHQPELPVQVAPPLFAVDPDNPNVEWLVGALRHEGGWLTAAQLCERAGRPVNDQNRRWVRALADASEGRVAGGQRGYKLVEQMIAEEYEHYRNWMLAQAGAMERRVIESDRVFYGRKAV